MLCESSLVPALVCLKCACYSQLEILWKTESLGGFAGYDMNQYAESLACSRELTDSLIDTPPLSAWLGYMSYGCSGL